MLIDWTKWMKDHHIKMRGDPGDDRRNAGETGGVISGSELETKVSDDAGTPSCRYIQKSGIEGPVS